MPLLKACSGPFSKDQCHFCYKTQFDTLYISTETKRAYCRDHIKTHHQQYPGDNYYVQVIKAKKPESEERQRKMVKLEINYKKDDELFDTEYRLVDVNGNPITEIDSDTQAIIQKVITSTSTAKAQELKSWSLEIQPCPHTISFKPSSSNTIDLTSLTCSSCDLDQNLWLCLTCGSVGCGRAQFGGVPGNTHALAHSDATGHTVAIKLGSLSRENQDVYCYSCDEEVSFPVGLEAVLAQFGIDLDRLESKEKGLMEMQIDQNLEWEFNLKDAHGGDLQKLFGEGLTGIRNLGNSCYLNSVIQVLFSIPAYRQRFLKPLTHETSSEDITFEMEKLANGLLSGTFSKPSDGDGFQKGISPDTFKYKISEDHEEFRSMKQQDSMEFLAHLLGKLDGVDPELNDIFKFVNVEKLSYGDGTVKLKHQIEESVSLPIPVEVQETDSDGTKIYKRQSFIEALSTYLAPESIELGGKEVLKSNYFKTFPKYLLTATQRIQLENWNPIKIDVPLTIPESFDLRTLQAPELILANEKEIQDDEEEETVEFVPNPATFEQLQSMGFPDQRAKRALFETDNASAEEAMEWLFQRMEDDSLDLPFNFTKLKKSSSGPDVDPAQVASLCDMGFSAKLATKALVLNKGDVNTAVGWLFENPEDDGELPAQQSPVNPNEKITKLEAADSGGSQYILKAVICHKGTQVTSGHYVAFVKIDDKWVLFNDEKVVDVTGDPSSWSEVEKNGYVYLWEKI